MNRFCRNCFALVFLLCFCAVPASAFAQSSGSSPGEEIPVPFLLGNTIFLGFIAVVFYIAIRSSRRDESAIKKLAKRKKGKQEPDFSKGPIFHPEFSNNVGLTLIGWFTGLPLLFTFPTAKRIHEEVKNDPRYKGEGAAQFGVVLNYIGVIIAPLLLLSILGVAIWMILQALNS